MIKDFKDLRKAAFAVGFGFTVGKAVGKYAGAALDGAILGVAKVLAKKGNKTMQEVLKKNNVNFEEKNKEEPKIKMGFQPREEA